jgi:ATP-binding cassette subfamily B protein
MSLSVSNLIERFGLRDLARAAQLVWRGSKLWTVVTLCLAIVTAVLPLFSLFLLKQIIDGIILAAGKSQAPADIQSLLILIAAAFLAQLLIVFCKGLAQVVAEAQAAEVTERMQDLLHRKSIEADLAFYETPEFKNTFHRAQQEGPYRPTRIVHGLAQLAQSSLSLAALSGLLLFSIHWAFGILLFASTLPALRLRFRQTRQMLAWQAQRTPIEREAEYYNWMLTSTHHAKENRLFGLGHLLKERAATLRSRLNQKRLQFTAQKTIGEFLSQAAAAAVTFGAFGVLATRAIAGAMTIGELVMIYQAFQRGLNYLQDFFGALTNLHENNLFIRNVFAFLDGKLTLPERSRPTPVPRPICHGIRFENVCFHYREAGRPCLEDVSLAIGPGEVVALVGENGAGKSTLIKLLCRMYDPTRGRITIDGTDIRNFSKVDLRNAISVVFQDFVQYALSARDNIWFGDVKLASTDPAILQSSKRAGADNFVRKLTKGYDSVLGTLFEGGEELSTGQWQKIALARAFLRTSQLIILDEPTSALDPTSEFEVFEKFRQLAQGRSTLLISHRLSTVKMADRIYVLSGGKIIEQGTHDELVEQGTNYANLYNAQAASYR